MRFLLALLIAVNVLTTPAMAAAGPTPPACTAAAPAPTAPDAKQKADADMAACLQEAGTQAARKTQAIIGFLAVTLAIVLFAWKTEVLRDSDPVDFPGVPAVAPPAGTPSTPGVAAATTGGTGGVTPPVAGAPVATTGGTTATTPPAAGAWKFPPITITRTFSLAQSQMVWWFWIVLSSFVYLAIYYREIGGGLNQEALTLIGVGAGGAIGAAIIEQARVNKGDALSRYNDATWQMLNPGSPPPQGTTFFPDPYDVAVKAAKQLGSDGYFRDILSDADGISLHRFQSAAWTVVLGIIFLFNVFYPQAQQIVDTAKQLTDGFVSMPVLTTFELTLLGISTGTYLGLKIPEKTPP